MTMASMSSATSASSAQPESSMASRVANDNASLSSTPATSVMDGSNTDNMSLKQDTGTNMQADPEEAGNTVQRRSGRARPIIDSYNVVALADLKFGKQVARVKYDRTFSGDTLVNAAVSPVTDTPGRRREVLEGQVEKALNLEWECDDLEELRDGSSVVNDCHEATTGASKLGTAVGRVKNALGKRRRDVASVNDRRKSRIDEQSSQEDAASVSVSIATDNEPRPQKKARILDTLSELATSLSRPILSMKKNKKKWLTQGLYCGQSADFKGTLSDSKRLSQASKAVKGGVSRSSMPYPMYSAGTRQADFRIPYDVFAPLRKKEIPKEWRKLSKNSFTPSAKEVWRTKKLERSICLCQPPAPGSGEQGCDENCLNRTMLYECDENNCNLTADQCTNRAFAELAKRVKKGNEYDVGVEIIKTKDCGYGLRANRCFEPGQIVIEYCGEVITQDESDRRMHEVYKDSKCYYLMEFDQGMIIDATKGNITRFVNHSCAPNCVMEKRIVKGEPKMALFAGPRGVMTGEELSYDYNFDNFSNLGAVDCRCGAEFCRGKLERRDTKKEKEAVAALLKRKLSEQQEADTPDPVGVKFKKRKTGRWSKGWSYIDPEMEAMRLQEDALEKGKQIDVRAVEALQRSTAAEAAPSKRNSAALPSGRGVRTASVAAKAKLLERASSVRNAIGAKRKSQLIDSIDNGDGKQRRRSMLDRVSSSKSNRCIVLDEIAISGSADRSDAARTKTSKDAAEHVEDTAPLSQLGSANSSIGKAGKSFKQTTISFGPPPEIAEEIVTDTGGDFDVLEMVLNAGRAEVDSTVV